MIDISERRVDTPAGAYKGPAKWCLRCKATKPLTPEFYYRDNSNGDGWMNHCKECHRKPSPNGRGFRGGRKQMATMGARGVKVHAGWAVDTIMRPMPASYPAASASTVPPGALDRSPAAPMLVVEAPPAAPVSEESAPVAAAVERRAEPMEMVEPSRSTMGRISLGEYMALEEAPSVWIGPAGVSVMATPGAAGGPEYAVLTPYGDAPGFRTDREAAHYIAGLLVDRHAAMPGAALEGVMVHGGGARR